MQWQKVKSPSLLAEPVPNPFLQNPVAWQVGILHSFEEAVCVEDTAGPVYVVRLCQYELWPSHHMSGNLGECLLVDHFSIGRIKKKHITVWHCSLGARLAAGKESATV